MSTWKPTEQTVRLVFSVGLWRHRDGGACLTYYSWRHMVRRGGLWGDWWYNTGLMHTKMLKVKWTTCPWVAVTQLQGCVPDYTVSHCYRSSPSQCAQKLPYWHSRKALVCLQTHLTDTADFIDGSITAMCNKTSKSTEYCEDTLMFFFSSKTLRLKLRADLNYITRALFKGQTKKTPTCPHTLNTHTQN